MNEWKKCSSLTKHLLVTRLKLIWKLKWKIQLDCVLSSRSILSFFLSKMATSSRVHGWTSLKTPVLSIILILFTRFQFSHVYSSPHAEVSHGVPEGSMVEPILFTLPKNLLLPVNHNQVNQLNYKNIVNCKLFNF